jgi:hydroxymethylbilane synthase
MATTDSTTILRLGTRGSLLARVQSQMVADELEKRHPGLRVELCIFKTSGDQIADRPLHEVGGKGLFTKELEQALLAGQVDLAVHSFKDVPVTMPLVDQAGLMIAAVPEREDPRDVLISLEAKRIQDLRPGAKVGTGSLRRRAQVLALRPDLQIEGVRGNIDTRVRKLRNGEFDAVILAMAGLKRSGLFDASIMQPIPPTDFLPAAGQGALALQCRRDDRRTQELLAAVHHEPSATCVRLERDLIRRLDGDCFSPIAAFATIANQRIELRVAVGRKGGELPVLHGGAQSDLVRPDVVVDAVFAVLSDQQIQTHLHG